MSPDDWDLLYQLTAIVGLTIITVVNDGSAAEGVARFLAALQPVSA